MLSKALKHLLLLSLKHLKYRALFQTGNTKKLGGEAGRSETPPCKMLSSCNDGDKSVLRKQEKKATGDTRLLREAFIVCTFLLPGGNAQLPFRDESLRLGERKQKMLQAHLPQGVF